MNSKNSKTSDPQLLLLNLKYDKFELPDGSFSVSDIQDYFESILKNMEKGLIVLQ